MLRVEGGRRCPRLRWRQVLSSENSPAGGERESVVTAMYAETDGSATAAQDASARLLDVILTQLDDDKAEEVLTIDLSDKSDMADAMVIASGRSQRHVGAMADKVLRALKDAGFGSAQVEGMPACDWVLIDAGDVILHLFRPEVRRFYNLERIWSPEALSEPAARRPH